MELLAPAGSFDALIAAVQSGADAVYIGGSEFSARRSAANFTIDEIFRAADYCHARNVKLHVAANILIKEKETTSFLQYIEKIGEVVDAVIIQDIGMAKKIREIFPDIPLHASTQMTVSGVAACKRLERLGFERVVLARELSLDEIEKIVKSTKMEVEVFAHGAICMCYSGQCLMSSLIGGRSGNRGMCAQPCRLPYELDKENGYFLSPKDLCALSHIKRLKEIGVASIKIEGRLKRKEYVACVCGIYRKYIDNPKAVEASDISELLDAFNRSGFTDGYLTGKTGKTMMSYENPSNISENKFTDAVKARTKQGVELKKVTIYISARLKKGECLSLSCWDDDGNYQEEYGTVSAETAINRPLSRERLKEQLEKLGNTPFYAEDTVIEIDDAVTIPVSEINAVRRALIENFTKQKCRRRAIKRNFASAEELTGVNSSLRLVCQVSTMEQATVCIEHGIKEIYADTPLANKLYKKFPEAKIIAKLPPIECDGVAAEKPVTDAILIQNIGQFDEDKECFGDFRLNVTNNETVKFYKDLKRLTLSPELNLWELSDINSYNEIIAYGRLPLMVMKNCPLKALGKCQNFRFDEVLKDRIGEKFPFKCNEGCFVELLNSKPLYLADKPEIIKKLKINAVRLIFTVENSEICGTIIDRYEKMIKGESGGTIAENSFTRGHFYRGTE